jgi:hypothetical protein
VFTQVPSVVNSTSLFDSIQKSLLGLHLRADRYDATGPSERTLCYTNHGLYCLKPSSGLQYAAKFVQIFCGVIERPTCASEDSHASQANCVTRSCAERFISRMSWYQAAGAFLVCSFVRNLSDRGPCLFFGFVSHSSAMADLYFRNTPPQAHCCA